MGGKENSKGRERERVKPHAVDVGGVLFLREGGGCGATLSVPKPAEQAKTLLVEAMGFLCMKNIDSAKCRIRAALDRLDD